MPCNIVIGGFIGYEGKGKIIVYLVSKVIRVLAAEGVSTNSRHISIVTGEFLRCCDTQSRFHLNTSLVIGTSILVNPNMLLYDISTFY
jgi:adenylosuccinate synthase